MNTALFDYEWQFLIQLITRFTYTSSYSEMCETLLQQLKTLIGYSMAVAFRTDRENGQAVIRDPISFESGSVKADHSRFLSGDYPRWSEFIMAPYSTVFRQSDLISPGKWEHTRVYREIWKPQGIYWGMFISVVSHDTPLAMIGLLRSKDEEDFSARDLYLFNSLKDPLERKLYSLLSASAAERGKVFPTGQSRKATAYGLTKRENEIVSLVCSGRTGDEICSQLFITPATLSKHLSNIYAKTGIRNRTQLFALFNN